MISLLKRYKRLLGILSLFGIMFLGGVAFLENNIEFTGFLFLMGSVGLFFYLLISLGLNKFNYIKITTAWVNREIWTALIIASILSVIGALESYLLNIEFILLFFVIFVFVLFLIAFQIRNAQIQKLGSTTIRKGFVLTLAFWCFTFGMGLILIILDSADKEEAVVITSLFYFPLLLFISIRWVFKQIKLLINLKNEQAKTELLHLKSQVNPHFFFNMLNNLYGIVEKDGKRARKLILKMSDMMRYSIYEGQKDQVTLEEEIAYLKNYVELHQMRYHKEISITFNTQIQKEGIKIMPLLFIILLENAFKHGVENLIHNPFVNINIEASESKVLFEIDNNFDPMTTKKETGIGLKNLKRRLELVYQNRHQLSFIKQENLFKATLSISPL